MEEIENYTTFLSSASKLLFHKFDSTYKRKKYYEDELGFIKPEEVLLKTSCNAPNDNSEEMIIKSNFGYYIPFDKCLENTLKNLPPEIDLQKNNHKNFKNDIFDGSYVQNLNKTSTDRLAILLYTDELELTNAVGSSRTKHKLSMNQS